MRTARLLLVFLVCLKLFSASAFAATSPWQWIEVGSVNAYVHVWVLAVRSDPSLGLVDATFYVGSIAGRRPTYYEMLSIVPNRLMTGGFNCRGYVALSPGMALQNDDMIPVPSGTALDAVRAYVCAH